MPALSLTSSASIQRARKPARPTRNRSSGTKNRNSRNAIALPTTVPAISGRDGTSAGRGRSAADARAPQQLREAGLLLLHSLSGAPHKRVDPALVGRFLGLRRRHRRPDVSGSTSAPARPYCTASGRCWLRPGGRAGRGRGRFIPFSRVSSPSGSGARVCSPALTRSSLPPRPGRSGRAGWTVGPTSWSRTSADLTDVVGEGEADARGLEGVGELDAACGPR